MVITSRPKVEKRVEGGGSRDLRRSMTEARGGGGEEEAECGQAEEGDDDNDGNDDEDEGLEVKV